ncbi:MAG: class I SAM-dependent methyltransferase [Micromonosporaceae bacterium]
MPAKEHDLFDYDAELCHYHEHLRTAIDVRSTDHVLDIGCGTGQATRDAARAAASGSALGIDISARMLTRARELSRQEGLRNISFVQADAQIHRFQPERFDLAISRFGTMFFADPVAAFTNIRGTLRPGARLVQLVWQCSNRQEWSAVIREVFAGEQPTPAPTADPFSLADPATAGAILTASGFTDAAVTGLHEPVYYGPDTATALDAVLTLQMTKDLLAPLDAARTQHALNQLRAALAAHQSRNGVLFDSHAWLITARRP